MSQETPPPALHPTHDADTLKAIGQTRTDLEAVRRQRDVVQAELKTLDDLLIKADDSLDALEVQLGARISGDLRPRILAYQAVIPKQQSALEGLAKLAKVTLPDTGASNV